MHSPLINFVLFQLGWFACVIGAAQNFPFIGSITAIAVIGFHLWMVERKIEESLLILCVLIVGYSWDSLLVWHGLLTYPETEFERLAPLWIAAMWAMFTTTLNSSMRWLHEKYLLAAILGAVFGPLAYYSAAKLGAVSFLSPVEGLAAQSVAWAVFMPAMLILNKSIYTRNKVFMWEEKR